jgi:hypothetical protein
MLSAKNNKTLVVAYSWLLCHNHTFVKLFGTTARECFLSVNHDLAVVIPYIVSW